MCGVGGTTRGFLDAGINVVKGYDIDPQCKDTYENNNYPAKYIIHDISHINSEDLLEKTPYNPETDYLCFIACAPCQPFSTAGVQDPND